MSEAPLFLLVEVQPDEPPRMVLKFTILPESVVTTLPLSDEPWYEATISCPLTLAELLMSFEECSDLH